LSILINPNANNSTITETGEKMDINQMMNEQMNRQTNRQAIM
jgi:hypothetical protein